MTKEIAQSPVACGSCGNKIHAGMPLYRVTKAKLVRCVACAQMTGGDLAVPMREPEAERKRAARSVVAAMSPLSKLAQGKLLDYRAKQARSDE